VSCAIQDLGRLTETSLPKAGQVYERSRDLTSNTSIEGRIVANKVDALFP